MEFPLLINAVPSRSRLAELIERARPGADAAPRPPAPLSARLAELTEARRLRSEGSPKELHDATGLAGRKARCRARTVANRLEKRLRRDVGRGAFPRG